MAVYAIQAGTTLQFMQPDGTLSTLTLPDSHTVSGSIRGRWAILGQQLVFVRAGSVNLSIDPYTSTVYPLNLLPPIAPPTLAAGSGTGLTGDYRRRASYAIKDAAGQIINESPLSPRSLAVTLANEDLATTLIPISGQSQVNCRRLYRTAADGEEYFHELDIDDNETTAFTNALPDASLSLLPSDPTLGNPPGTMPGTSLSLITEWNNRLWAVSSRYDERHQLLYTEDGTTYAWGNLLLIASDGEDDIGITGLIRRRDELGVCKRNRVLKIVGDSNEDFQIIVVAEGVGCVAPDSIVVVRDVGYFLAEDGVYAFGPDGVRCLSRDQVDSWFNSDTYFQRASFDQAVGGYNPVTDTYDLHLPAQGQATLNRWVSYDIRRQEWTGIHLTGKFTPSARALLYDANNVELPTIGGTDMYLYKMNQTGASDGGTAITIDWLTKFFSASAPDITHAWLQPTVYTKIQAAGALTVTPKVGGLGASAGSAKSIDMTADRNRLSRFGVGRLLQLRFQHSTDAQDVELYGFELPYTEVGRR